MSLSESELWERVRGLEGKTVYTISRKNPNTITEVTDSRVVIKDRRSKPSRTEIFRLYQALRKMGRVTGENLVGWTWSVTYAILQRAVPEEIECIPPSEGLSGIKLRQ